MKPLFYFIGVAITIVVLFVAYTDGGYHSPTTFYVAATASSYLVYSSVALAVTCLGKKKTTKGWVFFICGVLLALVYVPFVRPLIEIFYIDSPGGRQGPIWELFFQSPLIVGSLCIYRAFSLWSEGDEKKA
jgi:hypothetical protein